MDDAQRTAFARDGYIVIPRCVSADHLAALNADFDAHLQGDADGDAALLARSADAEESAPDSSYHLTDQHGNSYTGRRMWSQPFRDLIDNPVVLPILQELLGDPSWGHAHAALPEALRPMIRLDHDNIHFQGPVPAGGKPSRGTGLHGGPENWHITAVYELNSIGAGDGGFGCLPGSHTPAGLEKVLGMGIDDWRTKWTDSPWSAKHPDWSSDVPTHRVEGQAGDCVLFTEKLSHGTVPWQGSGERRTIFYKYVPFGMHHADLGYDVTDPELTPQQRQILGFSDSWFNRPTQVKKHTPGSNVPYHSNPALVRLHPLAQQQQQQQQQQSAEPPLQLVDGWSGPHDNVNQMDASKL